MLLLAALMVPERLLGPFNWIPLVTTVRSCPLLLNPPFRMAIAGVVSDVAPARETELANVPPAPKLTVPFMMMGPVSVGSPVSVLSFIRREEPVRVEAPVTLTLSRVRPAVPELAFTFPEKVLLVKLIV